MGKAMGIVFDLALLNDADRDVVAFLLVLEGVGVNQIFGGLIQHDIPAKKAIDLIAQGQWCLHVSRSKVAH
jgi:hypothetical protein